MQRDNRLSDVLHILLHMANADGPVTSETLAKMMDTNPVVVRRILAGLRKNGLVHSEKGHGGGWTIACDLHTVTFHDVYNALGSPTLFAIGNRTESPTCLVEGAINSVLNDALYDAETLLLARFRDVTLAMLNTTIHQSMQSPHGLHHH